jgi:hypothetical protein
MALRVLSRLQYLTIVVDEMRPQDYDATHLVKAIKGRDLNAKQYATVQVGGRWTAIRQTNRDTALEWFAEWAAPIVDGTANGQKVLIPIPSSKTTPSSADNFRTAEIARVVAAKCQTPAVIASVLRWTKPIPSASEEGGSRDPRILYPQLTLTAEPAPGTCVFIDDVATSGGHLIACTWKLADIRRIVELALCGGQTTHERYDDPFSIPEQVHDTSGR